LNLLMYHLTVKIIEMIESGQTKPDPQGLSV